MYSIDSKLYDFIMDNLEAKNYCQTPKNYNADNNLSNNVPKNLYRLARYFPRAYKMSYIVFKDMYEHFISNNYKLKDSIKILDIGSGTGGQLFGLLQLIDDLSLCKNIIVNYR